MSHSPKSCPCPSKKAPKRKAKSLSVLSGLLIVLLPKCPFCILTFSSAITLCSGAKIYQHAPGWASFISIGLAAATLALLAWNYKGWRTLAAAALVLAGSYFIISSELWTGELAEYYWGAFFLLLGVWVNGSFYFFFRLWVRPAYDFVREKYLERVR
ncbi:MAG: hypothetical protein J5I98_15855 [Phaeodactylibacter sp.]|nr:hypothetical protein [Phaeodactylibacter sp.]